jgi:FAD/FMN-containing dehydrogenase
MLLARTAAMLGLSALGGHRVARAAADDVRRTPRRVRPTDPDWPSQDDWRALARKVGGRLAIVPAMFDVCGAGADDPRCRDAIANARNPFYVGDQVGGTQVSGWAGAWTPERSVYAVAAAKTSDVVAAVEFAREKNLRLVVKGGGHSYQGTSNAPDSLLIWTRAMNAITLHERFAPRGCASARAQPAVTLEAGAMWIDAYDAVTTKAGRYVQGGGCTTVGVAGLMQSGGFGSFSKTFGTACAGLLEAEIVTADGVVRTVNACNDPELFWSLKGGGGGTFGVVTKMTLRTHDLPESLGAAEMMIAARSQDAFARLIARFVDFYADRLLDARWGESIAIRPDRTLRVSMVCAGVSREEVERTWRPFVDVLSASASDLTFDSKPRFGSMPARRWWDARYRKENGSDSMIVDARPGMPEAHAWWAGDREQVGALIHGYESLWLPMRLLRGRSRERLVDALVEGSRNAPIELHFNKGLAGAPAEARAAARATAMNPAVLDAFALAIVAAGGPPAYPGMPGGEPEAAAARANAEAVARAMSPLRALAPDSGAYVSESDYFERHWQRAFWGTNYARLRAIKAKYDPDGLFFVHHGVGSEEWSADGFTRRNGGSIAEYRKKIVARVDFGSPRSSYR